MSHESTDLPRNILTALESADEQSLLTIAAYLLLAGIWHNRKLREQCLPPEEDLIILGFSDWSAKDEISPQGLNIRTVDIKVNAADEYEREGRQSFYDKLFALIKDSIKSGSAIATSRAVAFGLHAPDPLVRICALGSALDLFEYRSLNLIQRLSWFYSREISETTQALLGVLMSRWISASMVGTPDRTTDTVGSSGKLGLMLLHGTVLPTRKSSRPTWSVPGVGALYNHINELRHDVYGHPDYFRWEGGYTDYAREVAALNLLDWLKVRDLQGIDIVAHSHGCNVAVAADSLGASFGKKILLNCPVHWTKYSLPESQWQNTWAVHIKFDFVILMDRGKQRFPPKTVKQIVLPIWFGGHSDATTPVVWSGQNLDDLL